MQAAGVVPPANPGVPAPLLPSFPGGFGAVGSRATVFDGPPLPFGVGGPGAFGNDRSYHARGSAPRVVLNYTAIRYAPNLPDIDPNQPEGTLVLNLTGADPTRAGATFPDAVQACFLQHTKDRPDARPIGFLASRAERGGGSADTHFTTTIPVCVLGLTKALVTWTGHERRARPGMRLAFRGSNGKKNAQLIPRWREMIEDEEEDLGVIVSVVGDGWLRDYQEATPSNYVMLSM